MQVFFPGKIVGRVTGVIFLSGRDYGHFVGACSSEHENHMIPAGKSLILPKIVRGFQLRSDLT